MTIQDILARYWRMNKKDVLWQPGTDHAGIATQKIVESNIKSESNLSKDDVGKENFIKKVWEWKNKSGERIINQIKRLGASPDWKRQRFTMDKDMSDAVNFTFIELYKKGLIIWAATIAYSRIYVGVHYPGDILVGAIFGIIIGWVFSKVFRFSLPFLNLQTKV